MKRRRYITTPWLLKQRTKDLVFIRAWLRSTTWKDTKNSPHLNKVMSALVEYIETELGMRDPRRLLKRRAIGRAISL